MAIELVIEPTHLKNMSQIGSFPAVKIENIWNLHQAILRVCALFGMVSETVTPSKGESWPPTFIRFGQRTTSSKDLLKKVHKFRNIKIRQKNTPTYKPFPNGFFSVPDQHLLFGMLLGVIFYDLAVGTKGVALGKLQINPRLSTEMRFGNGFFMAFHWNVD